MKAVILAYAAIAVQIAGIAAWATNNSDGLVSARDIENAVQGRGAEVGQTFPTILVYDERGVAHPLVQPRRWNLVLIGTCGCELERLATFAKAAEDSHEAAKIVMVANVDEIRKMKEFYGVKTSVYVGPKSQLMDSLNLTSSPALFHVDANGKVISRKEKF